MGWLPEWLQGSQSLPELLDEIDRRFDTLEEINKRRKKLVQGRNAWSETKSSGWFSYFSSDDAGESDAFDEVNTLSKRFRSVLTPFEKPVKGLVELSRHWDGLNIDGATEKIVSLDSVDQKIQVLQDRYQNIRDRENEIEKLIERDEYHSSLQDKFQEQGRSLRRFDTYELRSELREKQQAVNAMKRQAEALQLNRADYQSLKEEFENLLRENRKWEEKLKGVLTRYRKIHDQMTFENIILVHITDTFPKNGMIQPKSNYFTEQTSLVGNTDMASKEARGTIHFTLNGPVKDHVWGSFDGDYAVLVPAEKIETRLINLRGEDSFVIGDLQLPKGSDILVPQPEQQERGDFAGKAQLISYGGGNIKEVAKRRINQRGYEVKEIRDLGWDEAEEVELLNALRYEKGLKEFNHDESPFADLEDLSHELDTLYGRLSDDVTNVDEQEAKEKVQRIKQKTSTLVEDIK